MLNFWISKSFLKANGEDHCKELKSQGELLLSQKNSFDASHHKRKEFYESFVMNVLSGVEELVKKQMASVMEHENESFSSMAAVNSDLIKKI